MNPMLIIAYALKFSLEGSICIMSAVLAGKVVLIDPWILLRRFTDILTKHCNWIYIIKQSAGVRFSAQTGFAAFSKGVKLIISSPFAETE